MKATPEAAEWPAGKWGLLTRPRAWSPSTEAETRRRSSWPSLLFYPAAASGSVDRRAYITGCDSVSPRRGDRNERPHGTSQRRARAAAPAAPWFGSQPITTERKRRRAGRPAPALSPRSGYLYPQGGRREPGLLRTHNFNAPVPLQLQISTEMGCFKLLSNLPRTHR